MSRKVAVYGGSFNPFGIHHQDIIRFLIEEGGFGTVLVVPAAAHALKGDLLEYMHRYNMTKLGVNDLRHNGMPSLPFESNAQVSQIEMDMLREQAGPIRTYDLLKRIKKDMMDQDTEIKFAIGPDIPGELDQWANVDKIKAEFGFVEIPIQSMRATKLREMMAQGISSWKRHIPSTVARYIEKQRLYHAERSSCDHKWERTTVTSFEYPHEERCEKCYLPRPGSESQSWHDAMAKKEATQ